MVSHNPTTMKACKGNATGSNGRFVKKLSRICLALLMMLTLMVPYSLVNLHAGSPIDLTLVTMKGMHVHQERAAIVSLITGKEEDVKNLCNALTHLVHLPDVRNKDTLLADVVVFHERHDLSTGNMNRLSNCTANRLVRFAEVDFDQFPAGFDPDKEESRWQKRSKWGYSQMIRFFISGLWEHPAIADYRFVMRLDADACWDQIPFDDPEQRIYPYLPDGYVYQRHSEGSDPRHVCEGIYNFTANYVSANNIAVANPELWRNFGKSWLEEEKCVGFFNNFEITRLRFMQQLAVRRWHDAVTEREPFGVFRQRWGDALVRYLTLALFASPKSLLYHNNTEYYHHPCQGILPIYPDIVNGQKLPRIPRMPSHMTSEEAKKYGIKIVMKS